MKTKSKIVVSALLVMALCVSLIAGTTFALFTSESGVDIAVTAGTVAVSAKVDGESLATYSMNKKQANGKFENGGTAGFNDKSVLVFDNVTPGDSATFNITVKNDSTVTVKYRLTWSVSGELASVLTAQAIGAEFNKWAVWEIPAKDSEKIKTVSVSVKLPEEVGNEYQGKSANINFAVEAVQGNAKTDTVLSDLPFFADGNCYYPAAATNYIMEEDATYDKVMRVFYGDMSLNLNNHALNVAQLDFVLQGKKATISNGTITQTDDIEATGQSFPSAVYVWENNNVEFNDVTINAYEIDSANITAMKINVFGENTSTSVILSGDTVINGDIELQADPGNILHLVISDNVTFNGKFTYWGYEGLDVIISGGKFKNEPDAKWIAEGFEVVESDGYYLVQKVA